MSDKRNPGKARSPACRRWPKTRRSGQKNGQENFHRAGGFNPFGTGLKNKVSALAAISRQTAHRKKPNNQKRKPGNTPKKKKTEPENKEKRRTENAEKRLELGHSRHRNVQRRPRPGLRKIHPKQPQTIENVPLMNRLVQKAFRTQKIAGNLAKQTRVTNELTPEKGKARASGPCPGLALASPARPAARRWMPARPHDAETRASVGKPRLFRNRCRLAARTRTETAVSPPRNSARTKPPSSRPARKTRHDKKPGAKGSERRAAPQNRPKPFLTLPTLLPERNAPFPAATHKKRKTSATGTARALPPLQAWITRLCPQPRKPASVDNAPQRRVIHPFRCLAGLRPPDPPRFAPLFLMKNRTANPENPARRRRAIKNL